MDYATVKAVHLTTMGLSLSGFVLRGAGVLAGAGWARSRAARTLPLVNDTVLLASAVTLAWMLGASPFEQPWLAAKIAGLLLYIALGTVALKSRSRRRSAIALAGAVATFGYIVSVALTKSPLGWTLWLVR